MNRISSHLGLLGILFSGLTDSAIAKNWDWHGTFAQGFFHTDENNIYGPSKNSISTDFTEFSLNATYNPSYTLD